MQKAKVIASLKEIGLVPVLRAESVEKALALAEAIAAGGVTVLEVTMTVPGAIQVMRKLAESGRISSLARVRCWMPRRRGCAFWRARSLW